MNNLDQHIEAILFIKGEAMTVGQLAKILEIETSKVSEAIDVLDERLREGGLRLLRKDNSVMLVTAPESSVFVKSLVKDEFSSRLSKAGVETLAIVIYKGPVSRMDIDYVRGVNSAFVLRNLLVRGLVERVPDGRSYLYKPSIQLFQTLGINSADALPGYGDFNKRMEEFVQDQYNNENDV